MTKDKELQERYAKEKSIKKQAQDLYSRYGEVATWGACVQAVKTDWVSSFHNKYGPLLNG